MVITNRKQFCFQWIACGYGFFVYSGDTILFYQIAIIKYAPDSVKETLSKLPFKNRLAGFSPEELTNAIVG